MRLSCLFWTKGFIMNVYDVMTANPTVISPHAPVVDAIAAMVELGCHHLPVMSDQKHLIGILSFQDCQQALNDAFKRGEIGADKALIVSDVMTAAPIVIEPNAPASEAARLMIAHYIGSLPVMMGETLVGIVTRSDLLMAFMRLSEARATQRMGI